MSKSLLAAAVLSSLSTLAAEPAKAAPAKAEPARAAAAVGSLSKELATSLCADLRTAATRPEVAKLDKAAQLTGVLDDLSKKSKDFDAFMKEVNKQVPTLRRDSFKLSVTKALGVEWKCPDFDALWDGKGLTK